MKSVYDRAQEYVRSLLRRVMLWVIREERGEIANLMVQRDAIERLVKKQHEELKRVLNAMQAIDVGFQELGHIVICCRINGQDYVKIMDVPREWSLEDYKRLVEQIDRQYCAKARFLDAGPMFRGIGYGGW